MHNQLSSFLLAILDLFATQSKQQTNSPHRIQPSVTNNTNNNRSKRAAASHFAHCSLVAGQLTANGKCDRWEVNPSLPHPIANSNREGQVGDIYGTVNLQVIRRPRSSLTDSIHHDHPIQNQSKHEQLEMHCLVT